MVISSRSDKQQQASERRGSRRKNAHKGALHYAGGGRDKKLTKYQHNHTISYHNISQLIILIVS